MPAASLKAENENRTGKQQQQQSKQTNKNPQTTDQNWRQGGRSMESNRASLEIFKLSSDHTLFSFALTLKSNYYVSYDSAGFPVHPKVVIKD